MIELAELISELRRELQEAVATGLDARLRFVLGPVELEVEVGVDRQGQGGAKVRFWVIELSGDQHVTHSATQRIKLTLQPQLAGSDAAPWVSGPESTRER